MRKWYLWAIALLAILPLGSQSIIQQVNCPITLPTNTIVAIKTVSGMSNGAVILGCYILDPAGFGIDNSTNPPTIRLISSGLSTAVTSEVPSGTINSSNTVFTLAHPPVSGTVKPYLNGVRQTAGTDYSISTTTITFVSMAAPTTGSILTVDYNY